MTDLTVLDIVFPERRGLEVRRRPRPVSNVPIIRMTARAEEAGELIGHELGADDYVIKACSRPPRCYSAQYERRS